MIFVAGELLVDIFPNYRRIGGAPFNFAFHVKNLGLPVCFASRIGRDKYGDEILEMLSKNSFSTRDIQVDEKHSTGRVQVSFDSEGSPDFEILPDTAFDYIDFSPYMSFEEPPEMVYFGTLIQRTPEGFSRLHSFLDSLSAETLCFYDINLRQGTYQPGVIDMSLKKADIVKLNEEELAYLSSRFLQSGGNAESDVFSLMEKYGISALSLTRGSDGSELFLEDRQHFSVSAPNVDPIVDTVGAGDAYAAVLALGRLRGWQPDRILSLASMFSASICRIEGAVPEDPSFYQHMRNMIEVNSDG